VPALHSLGDEGLNVHFGCHPSSSIFNLRPFLLRREDEKLEAAQVRRIIAAPRPPSRPSKL
jgi:hypothetical protein